MEQKDWGFYKLDDFLNLPYDNDPWLIKPIIPAKGWVNLYGEPKKARKSYWALGASWAVSNSHVHNWLGFPVHHHGPVLYLQVDTPHDMWRQRVHDIHAGGYDLSNVYFASPITMPYPFKMETCADILKEKIDLAPKDACFISLDTGRQMHRGNENESKDMTIFMDSINEAVGLDKAKLLVTHGKKGPSEGSPEAKDSEDNEGGDLMKGNRGSTAVAGAVDTVVKLTTKGQMWYQGRAVAESHKRLVFKHVYGEAGYMWDEDVDPEIAEGKRLISDPRFKNASTWSLGRQLARTMNVSDDKGREIIRKLRGER